MKVWITKYALSEGIVEFECHDKPGMDGRLYTKKPGDYFSSDYKSEQWADSAEKAREQAFAIRTKKIASLRKQIAKLEKITF